MCLLCQGLAVVTVLTLTVADSGSGEPHTKKGKPAPEENQPVRTDAYGDALPPGALERLGTVRLRHSAEVFAVALSADGRTVASAGRDDTVRVWDAATGKERARFALPPPPVYGALVGLTPDGKTVAFSVPREKTIHLRDTATGKELHQLQWEAPRNSYALFTFSADGQTLASRTNDFTIRIWDVATGKERRRFPAVPIHPARHLAFSPDGKILAAACERGKLRLWDTATGMELPQLRELPYDAYCLAFSPDGKTLATGGDEHVGQQFQGICTLWEVATGKQRATIPSQTRAVLAIAFAADGRSFVAASSDGGCRAWDAATGKELHQFATVRETEIGNPVNPLAFSADGKTLAWVLWRNTCGVHVSDVATGKEFLTPGSQPAAGVVAFSADGKTLMTPCEDRALRLWDARTGRVLRRFEGQEGRVDCLHFLPNGKTVISIAASPPGSPGSVVRWWDVETGKELRNFQVPPRVLDTGACAFSADGKLLALGEADRSRRGPRECKVRLWDLATGQEVRQSPGAHQGSVTSVAFSPDNQTLASAGPDGTIRLWDVATGREIRRWQGPRTYALHVAFSADGRTVVSASDSHNTQGQPAGRMIVIREVATGKEVRASDGPAGLVSFRAFSPDGRLLAFLDTSYTLHLWDTVAGKEIRQFQGQQGWVPFAVFSPDGKAVASAGQNGTVLIWELAGQR